MTYFEDFKEGQVIELGAYPPLTEDDIITFARQWDPQPFHTDPEAAKGSMYGGLIASGWHTAAVGMRLLVDTVMGGSGSEGSPGLTDLRWLRPVRPGDSLSGSYTVIGLEPSASRPQVGKVQARTELRNQDGEAVLSWVSTGFFRRRETDQT